MKSILKKLTLLLVSTAFCVGMLELGLRVLLPSDTHSVASQLPDYKHLRGGDDSVFTIDPEFGFRPKLGTHMYSAHGILVNDYAREKKPSQTRVLCMGDSVMARHILLDAIKAEWEGKPFEWWNAGVESFNTVQEVKWYEKYNAGIEPDEVILFFHNNDFSTTPIAVPNEQGGVQLFMPNMPSMNITPWLFKHSRVYKRLLSVMWSKGADRQAIADEVQASLARLQQGLAEKDIPLTVVLLPIMKPMEQWRPHQLQSREQSLKMFEALQLDWIDLLPALKRGVSDGITLQESPGDGWHPSPELSAYFARHLQAEGLLE